ncbi:MAG TPA: helical backbone metal receptor [Methylomirabilota bacterium]|nr:helical backbone metal receptor [Methylomirabilota bacterium]
MTRSRFTVDDCGNRFSLDRERKRIVSLAPSATGWLVALGAGDRLVGIDEHSSIPETQVEVCTIGGFGQTNLETIRALEPDLVVAASLHVGRVVPGLTKSGIDVFVMLGQTLDQMFHTAARLASVAGVSERAAPFLAEGRRRLRRLVSMTLAIDRRPLVFIEFSPRGHTGGPGTFLDDLVSKAGGANLGGLGTVHWPVLRPSEVSFHDPEVIIVATYPGSSTPEEISARPQWRTVRAVRTGRVHSLDTKFIKRPGPGVLEGVERLASLLHPTLFKG